MVMTIKWKKNNEDKNKKNGIKNKNKKQKIIIYWKNKNV